MAEHATVRWLLGQRVTRPKGSTLNTWLLDGKLWIYDEDDCALYLRQGSESKRVCKAECLKLAVGFSVGAHEAIGLSQMTQLLKVIG